MDEHDRDNAASATILNDHEVCHDAIVSAIRCLDSATSISKGDHLKERTRSHEYKIYWPAQMRQLRRVRAISDDELLLEINRELYPPAKNDFPKKCLYSERRRLIVRELSFSEMAVLKSIVGRYVEHMVQNSGSFLETILCVVRVSHISTAGIFRIRKQADYTYIALTSTIYPQISHEILHKFLLNSKRVSPAKAYAFGADTDEEFTLDHELAINPKERKVVLEQMERDINLLQSLNLERYCILYVIAKREKAFVLQLPGAPYGPEVDTTIELERRDTIPHRHDIAFGAHATLAQLIPIPYKNYEFMERCVINFNRCQSHGFP